MRTDIRRLRDDLMKAFLKEHSYNMVKLFLNQIGMTVFGTMLALALSRHESLLIASGVFSVIFFLALNYSVLWEIGAKDKIRIDGGRLKPMPYKGAILSAGANLPNIILTLLMGLGISVGTAASEAMSIFCNAALRLLNGMYLSLIKLFEYTIYVSPKIGGAMNILTNAGTGSEVMDSIEILNGVHAGNSVEPIRRALGLLEGAAESSPEIAEAYSMLEAAYNTPVLADIWWWFLIIVIPSVITGFVAYYLGAKNIRIFGFLGKNSKKAAK